MADEPAGTYARHICRRLLIDLSWNSSRLEGNAYSLLETEQLLQAGRSDDTQLSSEAVMLLNHKAAIEFLLESALEADYTDGMLAIYELNDVSILREVFLQAYRRSAQRYTVIRGAVGDPDPFRVQYRQAIAEQVAEIVRACCDRREAVAQLRRWAEDSVVEADRKRFVSAAEETLAGIHEGNFARYRIRPSEFEAWDAAWNPDSPSGAILRSGHSRLG